MNKKQSIISAIISTILIINGFLIAKGIYLDSNLIIEGISYFVAAGAFAWSLWKNHNFTTASTVAQEILHSFKAGDYAPDDVIEEDEEVL